VTNEQQSAAAFTAYIRSNPPTVYSESLYSLATFTDDYASLCFPRRSDGKGKGEEERLSRRDMEILLKWLMRDCGVVVVSGDVSFLPFV
jgi:charged multivesicular body protein 7